MNKEQLKALHGLYVNNLVMHKYELTNRELENCILKNRDYAKALDRLRVPWRIQNQVAYAAENPENWINYNDLVINRIIEKYTMKGVV